KTDVMQSAHVYFKLARQLIRPPAATLIAVGGLSGTGKSALSSALAPNILPQPGAIVLRTDVLRKQQFEADEADRLPESAYQLDITRKIYEILAQRASRIISRGHSVIVDAVFAHESERIAIDGIARKLGVRFVGFFLEASLATRQGRIGRRERDASDATIEVAEMQEKYDIGVVGWTIIDASGTPEQTLGQCLAHFIRDETAQAN
ncbi:MAG TPA: AAA family ATPase, partial [Rhodopseudomonas sp.]|uniref:AAA family ATPase n=1 Tax=Rhodopseudomonas sp. TaxID=1078 RepID=UPI002ED9A2C3